MRLRSAFAGVAGLAVAAALAMPSAALADGPIIKYECTYQPVGGDWYDIPNCEANVTPWISVGRLGHSGWKLYCPDGAPFSYQNVFNLGVTFGGSSTDWSRSSKWIDSPSATGTRYTGNGSFADWLNGYAGKNVNPADYTPGWVDAFVINWSAGGSHSWRYAIGCSATNAPVDNNGVQVGPIPGGPDGDEMLDYPNIVPTAALAQSDDDGGPAASTRAPGAGARNTHLKRRSTVTVRPDRRIERLRELPLKPNHRTTLDLSCAPSERLVRGKYAVAYDTRRPPRRFRHTDTHKAGRRTYTVRVKVGKVARDTVWLQARAICEKR